MSTSHTPGPWFPPSSKSFYITDKSGAVIASCNEANSHLIAAAPEMLDALNVALMCMIGYTHRNEVIDNAIKVVDEAIKKATNE